jgi:hypothetical protein
MWWCIAGTSLASTGRLAPPQLVLPSPQVRRKENVLDFATYATYASYPENDRFTKTGSGLTYGKLKNDADVFLQTCAGRGSDRTRLCWTRCLLRTGRMAGLQIQQCMSTPVRPRETTFVFSFFSLCV